MTTQQSRPDLARIGAAGDSFDNRSLPAELAHTYGVGMSQTERDAANRRALVSLSQLRQPMLEQLARRFLQQSLIEALPGHWVKYAERLEQVGTPWADAAALTARRHAWLLATCGPADDVLAGVDDFLGVAR